MVNTNRCLETFYSSLYSLTENNVGKDGAEILSEALKANTTLIELDLSCEKKKQNKKNTTHK